MNSRSKAIQLLSDNGFTAEAARIESEKSIALRIDNDTDLLILLALGSVGAQANTTIGNLIVYKFN